MILRGSTRKVQGQISGVRRLFKKANQKTSEITTTEKKQTTNSSNSTSNTYVHEYSIKPDTFTYKVAAKDELDKKEPYNLVSDIFRMGGVEMMKGAKSNLFYETQPTLSSKQLAKRTQRPVNCKILTSDFIEDSLYNPNYGYFTKQVEIYKQTTPFDYNNIADIDQFMTEWAKSYEKYDQSVFKSESVSIDKKKEKSPSLQLWHTPTELFQPYYGEAIARYLLVNYKLNQYPYNDLIIYEMGGGNGTLMINILNFLKQHQPDVYKRTKYKIIEISSKLYLKQKENALRNKLVAHKLDTSKVEIINKSIFDWNTKVHEPCFFIGLEVLDNFAHDSVRFDTQTGEPYQGHVVVDNHGDFHEYYEKDLTSYTELFLTLREKGRYPILNHGSMLEKVESVLPGVDKRPIHPLHQSSLMQNIQHSFWPYRNHLSTPEYVPTRMLEFFNILRLYFPEHHFLTSDFTHLPKTIPGYNSPVVQTILNDKMINVDTYMAYQGYFDIMFPTDFNLAADLYRQVVGRLAKVQTHRDFLGTWGDIEATTTRKGENPMLDFYTNASFMIS